MVQVTATPGGDSSLLRRLNQAAVLRALRDASPEEPTLTELVRATAVARATVESALAGLFGRGLVAEAARPAEGPRQLGRPAKRYRFRAEAGRVLGLDIGVHNALALVCDLEGEVLGVRRASLGPQLTPAQRVAAARALARRALRGTARDAGPVRSTGVATTGIVAADHTVALSAVMPGWAGTDLAAAFEESLGARVVAGNDSKLAALGECWRGGAAEAQDVVYIHVGRRISAGILLGGKVLHGRHGAAGEIGVLPGSGWHTAHERIAAGWGNPETLFEAVRAGEPDAVSALDDFATDLVQGVAATVLTVDPDVVVVGGGLSRAGEPLLAPLRARLAELCLFPIEVRASVLGDQAAAHGAVRLALDEVDRELYGVR